MIPMIGLLAACFENKAENQEERINANSHDIIYGTSEDDWELSPVFELSVIYEDGEEGSYTVAGNKEGIGFTGPFPIIAKEKQKYFWFYFGTENIYDKPVQVKAIKEGTEEYIDILSGPSTFYESAEVSPGSINMPSHLRFPSAGIWKVLVYIDDLLYETIVVEAV